MAEDFIFRTFWHGSSLGIIHRLCLSSFATYGFRVEVFSYDPVANLPDTVVARDASEILPSERVYTYRDGHGASNPSLHSNLFRYKMLRDIGGWWIDADVLLLGTDIPSQEYVFAWEAETEIVGSAVIRAPAGCELMTKAYESCQHLVANDPEWGETGPALITKAIFESGLRSQIMARHTMYEIGWDEAQKLVRKDDHAEVVRRLAKAPFAHIWGHMLEIAGLQPEQIPAEGSYLADQLIIHNVV